MACASSTKQSINIPADLKQECPKITKFKGKNLGDLTTAYIHLVQQYKICAMRHSSLVNIK